MSTAQVYKAQPLDRSDLFHLDVKCYDYPLTMEHWGQIILKDEGPFTRYECEVFKRNGTILGYYVYGIDPIARGEMLPDLSVLRLGVMPSVRRQGIGSMLVKKLRDVCEQMEVDQFQMIIPEYVFDPDEARGITEFFHTNGIVFMDNSPNLFYHYGRNYDGLIFRSGGEREPVAV